MNQLAFNFSQPANVNPYKINIKRIVIERAEGECLPDGTMPRAECASIAEANKVLREWAYTAPEGGAYDKCDLLVEWEDGTEYQDRFDLQREHCMDTMLLQSFLEYSFEFSAGEHCPAHMTADRYNDYLEMCEEYTPGSKAQAKRMLVAYRLW